MSDEKTTATYESHTKQDSMSSTSSQSIEQISSPTKSEPKKKSWFKMKNLFEKVEDRPTPPQVYNYRIYMTAIMASAAAIIIGYDGGFIGGTVALDSFKTSLVLTSQLILVLLFPMSSRFSMLVVSLGPCSLIHFHSILVDVFH